MKNLCRALISIAAFALVYYGCSRILLLKSEDGIEQMQAYYLQKENTVDVLLLGSSHTYCDVNTGVLWDEYGISAFDLGGAEQPFWNSYYFLKEALKTQKPKVIVLDITIPGIRSEEYQPRVWSVTNLFGIHFNRNRIDATRISVPSSSFETLLNPMNEMHTRYSDLDKDDFIDSNRSVNYKGFDLRDGIVPYETPDMSGVTELTPMTEKEELYYRKIIELTREEKIPLLLVSVPFPVYEEAQKIYNYEFKIAKEEGVPYIDYNKGNHYAEMDLDFKTDMADEFHLNITGNEKFSKYLGAQLKETYDLTDHRGDEKYDSWEVNALIERQETAAARLNRAKTPEDYARVLKNENYITFFNAGSEADGLMSAHAAALDALGIGADWRVQGMHLILRGDRVSYASAEKEQKVLIDLKKTRLLLVSEEDTEQGSRTLLMVDDRRNEFESSGIAFIVYDSVLDRVVSRREFEE